MLALSWARMKSHYRHSFRMMAGRRRREWVVGLLGGRRGLCPAIEAETEMRWPRKRLRRGEGSEALALDSFSKAKLLCALID